MAAMQKYASGSEDEHGLGIAEDFDVLHDPAGHGLRAEASVSRISPARSSGPRRNSSASTAAERDREVLVAARAAQKEQMNQSRVARRKTRNTERAMARDFKGQRQQGLGEHWLQDAGESSKEITVSHVASQLEEDGEPRTSAEGLEGSEVITVSEMASQLEVTTLVNDWGRGGCHDPRWQYAHEDEWNDGMGHDDDDVSVYSIGSWGGVYDSSRLALRGINIIGRDWRELAPDFVLWEDYCLEYWLACRKFDTKYSGVRDFESWYAYWYDWLATEWYEGEVDWFDPVGHGPRAEAAASRIAAKASVRRKAAARSDDEGARYDSATSVARWKQKLKQARVALRRRRNTARAMACDFKEQGQRHTGDGDEGRAPAVSSEKARKTASTAAAAIHQPWWKPRLRVQPHLHQHFVSLEGDAWWNGRCDWQWSYRPLTSSVVASTGFHVWRLRIKTLDAVVGVVRHGASSLESAYPVASFPVSRGEKGTEFVCNMKASGFVWAFSLSDSKIYEAGRWTRAAVPFDGHLGGLLEASRGFDMEVRLDMDEGLLEASCDGNNLGIAIRLPVGEAVQLAVGTGSNENPSSKITLLEYSTPRIPPLVLTLLAQDQEPESNTVTFVLAGVGGDVLAEVRFDSAECVHKLWATVMAEFQVPMHLLQLMLPDGKVLSRFDVRQSVAAVATSACSALEAMGAIFAEQQDMV